MKKLLIVGLSLAMLLNLIACGEFSLDENARGLSEGAFAEYQKSFGENNSDNTNDKSKNGKQKEIVETKKNNESKKEDEIKKKDEEKKTDIEEIKENNVEKYESETRYDKKTKSISTAFLDDLFEMYDENGEIKEKKIELKITTFGKNEDGREIEWLILYELGEKSLLIAKNPIIGTYQYNSKLDSVTWESCGIREYLNNEFLNKYFDDDEIDRIIETNLKNTDNEYYKVSAGNDTVDKVFLLSIDEVKQYLPDEEDRIIKIDTQSDRWWLRSPGEKQSKACYIDDKGQIKGSGVGDDSGGMSVDNFFSIRPAIWIKNKVFRW